MRTASGRSWVRSSEGALQKYNTCHPYSGVVGRVDKERSCACLNDVDKLNDVQYMDV